MTTNPLYLLSSTAGGCKRKCINYVLKEGRSSCVLVTLVHNPRYLESWDHNDCSLRPALTNNLQDPIVKRTRTKWIGSMTREEVHLPWICKALSSNSAPIKKRIEVFFCVVLRIEPRVSHMLHEFSTTKPNLHPLFSHDRALLCNPGWLWTPNLFASASWMMGWEPFIISLNW
jgi:hypothetical protein